MDAVDLLFAAALWLPASLFLAAALVASSRRVGGLYHWRVGRLGGCVYLARRRT
jgi:hypothetical protein